MSAGRGAAETLQSLHPPAAAADFPSPTLSMVLRRTKHQSWSSPPHSSWMGRDRSVKGGGTACTWFNLADCKASPGILRQRGELQAQLTKTFDPTLAHTDSTSLVGWVSGDHQRSEEWILWTCCSPWRKKTWNFCESLVVFLCLLFQKQLFFILCADNEVYLLHMCKAGKLTECFLIIIECSHYLTKTDRGN